MKTSVLTLASLLLGVVLLVTPFVVGLTTSEFSPEPPGVYSAWADMDDDGDIDIFDLVWMSSRYATTGVPSKNVNVTNWPESWPVTVNVTVLPEKEPRLVVVCENYTIDGTGETILLPFVVDMQNYNQFTLFYSYLYQPSGAGDSWLYLNPKALNITPKPNYGMYLGLRLVYLDDSWQDHAYAYAIDVISPELVFHVDTVYQTSLSLTIYVYLYN